MSDRTTSPVPGSVTPLPPRYWWLKRIVVAVAFLLVGVGLLRWWWGAKATRALDAEIAAIQARGEPLLPEDFDAPAVPDAENAAILLKKAATSLAMTSAQRRLIEDLIDGRKTVSAKPEEKQVLLDALATVRPLVHQAAGLTRCDWRDHFRGVNARVINRQPYWDLVGLMSASVNPLHAGGDDHGACLLLSDMLAVGRHLQSHGALLMALTGNAAFERAADWIGASGSGLQISSQPGPDSEMACSLAQVRALIDAFLAVDEQRRGLVRGIVTERAWQFEMVQAVCGPEGIRLFLAGSPRSGNPLLSKWNFLIRPTFQLDGARLMQDDSRAVQAAAAPTWPQADCLLSRRFRKRRDGFKLASQLLSAFMWYDFSYPLKESYETIAKRRMAATALAIRLYVVDHGAMPRTLEELVPRYLPEVPRDPCTADQPVEFGQSSGVPYLLSVGCRETYGSVTPVRFWLGPKPANGPRTASSPAG